MVYNKGKQIDGREGVWYMSGSGAVSYKTYQSIEYATSTQYKFLCSTGKFKAGITYKWKAIAYY